MTDRSSPKVSWNKDGRKQILFFHCKCCERTPLLFIEMSKRATKTFQRLKHPRLQLITWEKRQKNFELTLVLLWVNWAKCHNTCVLQKASRLNSQYSNFSVIKPGILVWYLLVFQDKTEKLHRRDYSNLFEPNYRQGSQFFMYCSYFCRFVANNRFVTNK